MNEYMISVVKTTVWNSSLDLSWDIWNWLFSLTFLIM